MGTFFGNLRFDAHAPFNASTSWRAFNAGSVDGLNTTGRTGYTGAVFDGRFVCFVPNFNGAGGHGNALRYDTHKQAAMRSEE